MSEFTEPVKIFQFNLVKIINIMIPGVSEEIPTTKRTKMNDLHSYQRFLDSVTRAGTRDM